MSDTAKVLVVVDDGEIRIHHTPGVDVVCIVDGENMELPIDWTGKLIYEIKHRMPITVAFEQMFREPGDDIDVILEDGIFVVEEESNVTLHPLDARPALMKEPYCEYCDMNHLPGDHLRKCANCGVPFGEKHATSCADQNPLVEGGDIVR